MPVLLLEIPKHFREDVSEELHLGLRQYDLGDRDDSLQRRQCHGRQRRHLPHEQRERDGRGHWEHVSVGLRRKRDGDGSRCRRGGLADGGGNGQEGRRRPDTAAVPGANY